MRQLILVLFVLIPLFSDAQTSKRGHKVVTAGSDVVGTLSILGSTTVAEGSTLTNTILLTYPNSTTQNVTSLASLTATKGVLNTTTKVVSFTTNAVRGDTKRGTLIASYNGLTVTKRFEVIDQTVGYVASSYGFVTVLDASLYPYMRPGIDYIVRGANSVSTSNQQHSVQIRASLLNVPTLSDSATVFVHGGGYDQFYFEATLARSTNPNKRITITNYDGRVVVRDGFTIMGAQGCHFTGKYVLNVSGDYDYRGHDGGYAFSAGTYGMAADNEGVDLAESKSAINFDGGAKNVEIDYMEFCNGFFAGVLINSPNIDSAIPGSTVKLNYENFNIHDLYGYHNAGEPLYAGSTQGGVQAHIENLELYNNRFLRNGVDGPQVGQSNGGINIHNNIIHCTTRWQGSFQIYQGNGALQLSVWRPGHKYHHNMAITNGDKFGNLFTVRDTLPYNHAVHDTISYTYNAHLYSRGTFDIYLTTQQVGGVRQSIDSLMVKFKGNYFGRNAYRYDSVYTGPSAINTNYLIKADITGAATKVWVEDNVHDGSDGGVKTLFVSNSQSNVTNPVYQTNNTLSGSVPAPEFINYMGLPVDYNYAKVFEWAATIGEPPQWTASGTRKGLPLWIEVDDIVTHRTVKANGRHEWVCYQAKVKHTGIEPGVNVNSSTYWKRMYWNKTTGAIVYDATNTTNLSNIPPDDVRLVPGSFYHVRNIKLN